MPKTPALVRTITFTLCSCLALLTACKEEAKPQEGEDFLAPAAPTPKVAPGQAKFEGAGAVLPRDAEVKGWKLKEGPAYYDSSTLYEVINGASAGYMAYGFKQMAKADYAATDIADFTEDIVVEAYRMRSPLAAFGKYSEERSSCDPPAKNQPPGCSRGSDRILHRGDWFVKVTTYDDSPAAVRELRRIAQAVHDRTEGEVLAPKAASRLPTAKQKGNSVVYRPSSLLGLDGLGEGFQADYTDGDKEWSLFIRPAKDAGEAAQVLARLRNDALQPGFAKAGEKIREVQGLGDAALSVATTSGWVVAATAGADVVGGVEFPTQEEGVAAVRELLTAGAQGPK